MNNLNIFITASLISAFTLTNPGHCRPQAQTVIRTPIQPSLPAAGVTSTFNPALTPATAIPSPVTPAATVVSATPATPAIGIPGVSAPSTSPLPQGDAHLHARAVVVSPHGGPVSGIFDFISMGSTDVKVSLAVSGLDQVSPVMDHTYHIHMNALASDGNCDSALGHLVFNGAPDSTPCTPETLQLCQEGDLSGKHRPIPGGQSFYKTSYVEKYLKFPPDAHSIVGRSVVIHGSNSARLACGNITLVQGPPV